MGAIVTWVEGTKERPPLVLLRAEVGGPVVVEMSIINATNLAEALLLAAHDASKDWMRTRGTP